MQEPRAIKVLVSKQAGGRVARMETGLRASSNKRGYGHKHRPTDRPRHMGTGDTRRPMILQVREKTFSISFQMGFQSVVLR